MVATFGQEGHQLQTAQLLLLFIHPGIEFRKLLGQAFVEDLGGLPRLVGQLVPLGRNEQGDVLHLLPDLVLDLVQAIRGQFLRPRQVAALDSLTSSNDRGLAETQCQVFRGLFAQQRIEPALHGSHLCGHSVGKRGPLFLEFLFLLGTPALQVVEGLL